MKRHVEVVPRDLGTALDEFWRVTRKVQDGRVTLTVDKIDGVVVKHRVEKRSLSEPAPTKTGGVSCGSE